jgi:cytochrome c-type biogenesis protein CcmH/NrfG
MTKGGIDNSEAQMLIAMSLYQQGKYAEAEAAFGQVQGGSPATPRIARLWAIQSKLKSAPATAAAP